MGGYILFEERLKRKKRPGGQQQTVTSTLSKTQRNSSTRTCARARGESVGWHSSGVPAHRPLKSYLGVIAMCVCCPIYFGHPSLHTFRDEVSGCTSRGSHTRKVTHLFFTPPTTFCVAVLVLVCLFCLHTCALFMYIKKINTWYFFSFRCGACVDDMKVHDFTQISLGSQCEHRYIFLSTFPECSAEYHRVAFLRNPAWAATHIMTYNTHKHAFACSAPQTFFF